MGSAFGKVGSCPNEEVRFASFLLLFLPNQIRFALTSGRLRFNPGFYLERKKLRTIEIWKVMAAAIQWGDYNREGSELNSSRGPLSESCRAVRGQARGSQVRQPECRS